MERRRPGVRPAGARTGTESECPRPRNGPGGLPDTHRSTTCGRVAGSTFTRPTVVGTLLCTTPSRHGGHRKESAGPALRRPPQPTRQGRESQQGASCGLPACDRIRALEGAQESREGFDPTERWGSHFWGQAPPQESTGLRAPQAWSAGPPRPSFFQPRSLRVLEGVKVWGSSIWGYRGETVPGHVPRPDGPPRVWLLGTQRS